MKKLSALLLSLTVVGINMIGVQANDEVAVACGNNINPIELLNEENVIEFDEEKLEKGTINTIYVDEEFTFDLQKSGCYGDATFRVYGSYDIEHNGTTYEVVKHRLSVELVDYTAEWEVYLDSARYTLNDSSVTVKISYHYLQPYFDCPIGGGYTYTSSTVEV